MHLSFAFIENIKTRQPFNGKSLFLTKLISRKNVNFFLGVCGCTIIKHNSSDKLSSIETPPLYLSPQSSAFLFSLLIALNYVQPASHRKVVSISNWCTLLAIKFLSFVYTWVTDHERYTDTKQFSRSEYLLSLEDESRTLPNQRASDLTPQKMRVWDRNSTIKLTELHFRVN